MQRSRNGRFEKQDPGTMDDIYAVNTNRVLHDAAVGVAAWKLAHTPCQNLKILVTGQLGDARSVLSYQHFVPCMPHTAHDLKCVAPLAIIPV